MRVHTKIPLDSDTKRVHSCYAPEHFGAKQLHQGFTMRPIPPLGVRLPEELKVWLKRVAADSRRSLNSEVIVRLEESRKRDAERQAVQQ